MLLKQRFRVLCVTLTKTMSIVSVPKELYERICWVLLWKCPHDYFVFPERIPYDEQVAVDDFIQLGNDWVDR